jgi:hypothetical protein
MLTQAPPQPDSPYPGIKSFRFLDQQIFSSREEETWNLLSNILIYRGVLLYGDSGSGKSSLINAGLTPAALKENFIAHRLRIQPEAGKEIKVERIPIELEDKPPYLPSVFVKENSATDKLLNVELSLDDFLNKLKALKSLAPGEPRPLLIFDQFEEFITLFEEAMRTEPATSGFQRQVADTQQPILEVLTRLLEDEYLPIKLLFVFREDYLAKLNPLLEACPELLDQYVRLLPPRVEEAEEIILAPFADEDVKGKFADNPAGRRKEIFPDLAEVVSTQLQQRSDSGFINLSELQVVCRKLWDSTDPARYFAEKDSDVQKVVEDYWADVLKGLGVLYGPAIALLGHMVTSSNTRNIISEPDLKTREKDLKPKQIEATLKALVERKLVRREPRNIIYFYEIVSEFLVPWIQQKRAERLAEARARELAVEARNNLEQAERRNRRLLIGASVLVLLLVVAIASTVYAFNQRRIARDALQNATYAQIAVQKEKDRSGKIITLLNQLTSGDSTTRLKAINELVALHQSHDLEQALAPVIVAVSSKDENQDVSKAAAYFFDVATKDKGGVTTSILRSAESNTTLADASQLAPRIYIQIASDRQRPRANKIAAELQANGFTVPGVELVDSHHAPPTNQLRYYKSADESQTSVDPNVEKILQLITATGPAKWASFPLPSSARVRSGHFEIWFARDPQVNDGSMVLDFEDEDGNAIQPKAFKINLTSAGHNVLHPPKNSTTVTAPAGKYLLTIRVPGYKDFQTEIEITGGETLLQTVTLQSK